jgi:hypothetical protein
LPNWSAGARHQTAVLFATEFESAREKNARGGGWLNVLDRTCECGTPPEQ